MAQYKVDLRDVRFVLFEQLGVGALAESERFGDQGQEVWDAVLDEAAKLATNVLSPINGPADHYGCKFEGGAVRLAPGFKEAYAAFREGGWISLMGSQELGGMGLPSSITAAATEMFVGACASFYFTPGLTAAAASLIEHLGSEEQRQLFVPRMNSGEWAGTMCLTEPQAGSAVGDCRSSATKQDDGSYLVTGNKIFISQGEHDLTEQIIHLVLARTPGAPPGTKGLSLFIVPKRRINPNGSLGGGNDVRCTGIEEKMGIHASATCSLSFGDEGACQGWIIGAEGEGMRHMFHMMNEARIAVGIQGVGMGNAAYQLALEYAKERVQGTDVKNFKDPAAPRVPIIEHPNVRRMLMEIKALSEGIRALIYRTAFEADRAETAATQEERDHAQAFVEILTPVVKAYGAESALRATDIAIQVLGGYGYIKEYGVEQLMRDVKIASIYEGTNSIQAIDLIGRKVPRKGGRDFMGLLSRIDAFVKAHKEHPALASDLAALAKAKDALGGATMFLGGYQMKGDLAYPIQVCKQYLEMVGDVVTGWLLLEQGVIGHERVAALVAADPSRTATTHPDVKFYEGKVKTAQFFARQILPRALGNAARIQSKDTSALDIVL
ncbi:MAG: acyl-CoA dehydrogenase [Myxococcales bacterium]